MNSFNEKPVFNFNKDDNTPTTGAATGGRIPTGLGRLDELLAGGLPEETITLVSGTPGSGKTIMCFHYIAEGIRNGEKCLFLSSDERIEHIVRQSEELGFNFDNAVSRGLLKFKYLDLDKSTVHDEMEKEIKNGNFRRVVLDSLTPLSEVPVWMRRDYQEIIPTSGDAKTTKFDVDSTPALRMHIRRIIGILSRENCTAMLTSEVPEGSRSLSRDSISEFMVDGIILMDLDTTMDRRKLTIRKMRATRHTLKPQDITITEGGIKFL